MMDSEMPYAASIRWFEVLEIAVFSLLAVLVAVLIMRCYFVHRPAEVSVGKSPAANLRPWYRIPELQLLMLALPLHLLWEIAQFPLYTVRHEGDWGYILYGLVHCTLGDLLIVLSIFWLVSLLNRNRYWIYGSPVAANVALFTVLGVVYTVYSEIVNTRIKGTWGYTDLMPIVPVIEIGGTPFLQWLLISPVLIWLMRLTNAANLRASQSHV